MDVHCAMTVVCVAVTIAATVPGVTQGSEITIRSDFPGGNVVVKGIEGNVVHLEPDLRGGREWFYWCFEVQAATSRRVSFVFPEKQMRFVSMQGPAVSLDGGGTWDWLGAAGATGSSFHFDFESDQTVRFAVTIPYLQDDLDRFLEQHADNEHLSVSLLTRSRQERPVELLQIGQPGEDRIAVLMTARHHACESMASYLLEGFLRAAVSDTQAGRRFRESYVLYVVPIVDKDGVQAGDQGKNRNPHDHNRDYGEDPRYPEVAAIMELATQTPIRIAVDFHCPTLWMDYHQVIYFVGSRDVPDSNLANVTRLADVLKQELPVEAPRGCLVLLKSGRTPGLFSDHFAHRDSTMMAMTLEFPYAPPDKQMDPASCVEYGAALLRAWNEAGFEAR